jgi:hypothetical protein
VAALSHAPASLALPRLAELFPELGAIQDTYTTNSHYSLTQLRIIESVVLTGVNLARPDDLQADDHYIAQAN